MWMNSLRLGSIVILCSLLGAAAHPVPNRLVGQSLNWINQLFKICHLIIYLWVSAKITQAQHIPNKAYKGGDFMLEFGALQVWMSRYRSQDFLWLLLMVICLRYICFWVVRRSASIRPMLISVFLPLYSSETAVSDYSFFRTDWISLFARFGYVFHKESASVLFDDTQPNWGGFSCQATGMVCFMPRVGAEFFHRVCITVDYRIEKKANRHCSLMLDSYLEEERDN